MTIAPPGPSGNSGHESDSVEPDGPTLRRMRLQARVSLREVARLAGFSHGHLSKVESGVPGRRVTPPVLAAYNAALAAGGQHDRLSGHLHPSQRLSYTVQAIDAALLGTTVPPARRLRKAGTTLGPVNEVNDRQLSALTQAVTVLAGSDNPLIAGQMARGLLEWVIRMPTDGHTGPRVRALVAELARIAAVAAAGQGRHQPARALFLLGLEAAAEAGDPHLRAQLLTHIAAHELRCGHRENCLRILALADTHEGIAQDLRARIKQLRAAAQHRRR